MINTIFETAIQILAVLLTTMIGVLGAWLTAKIAKRNELANISAATNELIGAAQLTVLELQQTVVDGWKAASADGKLSPDEIKDLSEALVDMTLKKMSSSAQNLLTAAGVDVTAIIKGAGEAMIRKMKES